MKRDAEATRYWPVYADVEFIVASPLARGTMGYKGVAEKDVYDVLADVKRRFSIDEDRVYLTGLSMGGGGAFWLGLTRPDVWAAIARRLSRRACRNRGSRRECAKRSYEDLSGRDRSRRASGSARRWHKRLCRCRRESGVRRVSRASATILGMLRIRTGRIFDWFAQFKRERNPEHVTFSARSYRHGSAYWVRFDAFTPGTLAEHRRALHCKEAAHHSDKELDAFTLR